MKKIYIHPTMKAYRLTQKSAILSTSGSVEEKLEKPSADPADGETMSVREQSTSWGSEW